MADVAIIGASFAGLACAQAAASRGLSVRVYDRQASAGERVRTTGILVKELADAWEIPRVFTRKIHAVRVYAPSLRFVDLCSPGHYFLSTDTRALLQWAAQQAERAGAHLIWGAPYRGAERRGDGVRLHQDGARARILVGADGARSTVARDWSLAVNRSLLVGAEVEVAGVEGLELDALHVFVDRALAPGYIAWAVPGVEITQVGLAAGAGTALAPRLRGLLDRLTHICDMGRARVVGRRSGLIPVGGPLSRIARGPTLLIGDAAGWVSPLSAGGLHPAVDYGRLAGIALSDHLLDDGPEPARVLQRHVPRYALERLLRASFEAIDADAIVERGLRSPLFRALLRQIFFHHRGLLPREAWRGLREARRAERAALGPG